MVADLQLGQIANITRNHYFDLIALTSKLKGRVFNAENTFKHHDENLTQEAKRYVCVSFQQGAMTFTEIIDAKTMTKVM